MMTGSGSGPSAQGRRTLHAVQADLAVADAFHRRDRHAVQRSNRRQARVDAHRPHLPCARHAKSRGEMTTD